MQARMFWTEGDSVIGKNSSDKAVTTAPSAGDEPGKVDGDAETPAAPKKRAPKTLRPAAGVGKSNVRKKKDELTQDLLPDLLSVAEHSHKGIESPHSPSGSETTTALMSSPVTKSGSSDPPALLEKLTTLPDVDRTNPADGIQSLNVKSGAEAGNWQLLTNRSNLLTMIGSGCITTQDAAWRYSDDSRAVFDGALPFWQGVMPAELRSLAGGKGVSAPVILEFFPEVQNWLPGTGTNLKLTRRTVPFSLVQSVVFKDPSTLQDFRLKQFDDLPELSERLMKVGFAEVQDAVPTGPSEFGLPETSTFSFGSFDRILGAMISAVDVLEARPSVRSLCCGLLAVLTEQIGAATRTAGRQVPQFMHSEFQSEITDRAEDLWLLDEVLELLAAIEPDSGFDAFRFLDQIEAAAKKADVQNEPTLNPKGKAAVCDWASYCRQILDGSKEVWPLTDASNTFIQRGVLLFILRPEQERLRKAQQSSIRPGRKVYLVAAFILGYFTGMTRLESASKKNTVRFHQLVEHFLRIATSGIDRQRLAISIVQSESPEGKLEIRHGQTVLREIDLKIPESIRKLARLCVEAKVNAMIDVDEGLIHIDSDSTSAIKVSARALKCEMDDARVRLFTDCTSVAGVEFSEAYGGQRAIFQLQGRDDFLGKFAIDEYCPQVTYSIDVRLAVLTANELRFLLADIARTITKIGAMAIK